MTDIDTISMDISDPKYRHNSISFTAALFGLLVYFIIARKLVSDVNVIP